jgi:hypothetical protein
VYSSFPTGMEIFSKSLAKKLTDIAEEKNIMTVVEVF